MIDREALLAALDLPELRPWRQVLPAQLDRALDEGRHGDLGRWRHLVAGLPAALTQDLALDGARVRIGRPDALEAGTRRALHSTLRALQPWRKGPFEVFGIPIDSEWRSDWKWARLASHIQPLAGRRVLDVGCGNGYYLWRMVGAGARLALGIDPSLLYLAQFSALRRLMATPPPAWLLPLGIEEVPPHLAAFDTLFSMGVLYHRRDPIGHLETLRGLLRPGGELVLETLVVTGGPDRVLVPPGRYAKMRNVWFIPSPAALVRWVSRCGFDTVRVVDVTPTTTAEQRRTSWMAFESLADFLDPADPSRTVEGLPAPTRALLLARRAR